MNKYVLFSPIGNHDPFGKTESKITEGPLLHIIRHYKPKAVILFLTKEMYDKEQNDNRYTKSIEYFYKKDEITIEILEDGKDIVNAHKFDEFIEIYAGIFNKINKKYPEYEILYNVTSATTQMISALVLEAQTSNVKAKAIQVVSPEQKSNTRSRYDYEYDDIEYIDENFENENNRCIEPDFLSFKKMQLKAQIKSLIHNYEYRAALDLIKNEPANLLTDNITEILTHLHYRSIYDLQNARVHASKVDEPSDKLKKNLILDKNLFEYFYTIKLKHKKGELGDMVLKITPFITQILRNEVEKCYDLQSLITKSGDTEFICRETVNAVDCDLLKYLDEQKEFRHCYNDGFVKNIVLFHILGYVKNRNSKKDCVDSTDKILNKFIDLEQNIRNNTAHEMKCVDENVLKSNYNGVSKDIIRDLEILLKQTNNFPQGKFVYDELNQQIMEIM